MSEDSVYTLWNLPQDKWKMLPDIPETMMREIIGEFKLPDHVLEGISAYHERTLGIVRKEITC